MSASSLSVYVADSMRPDCFDTQGRIAGIQVADDNYTSARAGDV
jgi:hypothetical protein